ncbi:N-formylglutamate amidohydrolase [Mesorhizobium sp. GR13]|uniref:N-formylglutamate amidohydrolase n=1 Tax=Mesorhizobium sp. GR13 TaxID=2562308 RepID=UPI0010C018BC|nr:N-formylglutamate amidohydrolase [Mesorhizobium sp. GR13]
MQLAADTVAALKANACEVLRPDSGSPLLLLCEHAGNLVPAPWRNLGLAPEFLETHYGYDPGVDRLTRALSQHLEAPAVIARYSRIFLDYNRFASDWDHMRPDLGGIPVPGNLNVNEAERALRRSIAVEPLDMAITGLTARRKAVVSVHSFTPVMGGHHRPVDIGILWREDSSFVRQTLAGLKARGDELGLRTGDNEPYDWRAVVAYSLQAHALDLGLPCFYLEVNNALFSNPEKSEKVALLLADVMRAAVA